MTRVLFALRLLAFGLLTAVTLHGCGGGIPKYTVTGTVTYEGKPIRAGTITFEPREGPVTQETMAFAVIRDGKYEVEIVGGPHKVVIRDLSDDPDIVASEAEASPPLFTGQITVDVDFPKKSPTGVFTHDFRLP